MKGKYVGRNASPAECAADAIMANKPHKWGNDSAGGWIQFDELVRIIEAEGETGG